MDFYGEQDVEYQRVTNYDHYVNPREFRFRLGVLTIFFLNLLWMFFGFYSLVKVIMSGIDIIPTAIIIIFNLSGLIVLGNGLFGQKYRKSCFTVYICLYELLPFGLYMIIFLSLTIGYTYFTKLIQEKFDKQHLDLNASTIMFCLIIIDLLAALYHALSAWIIHTYKKLRSEWNTEF